MSEPNITAELNDTVETELNKLVENTGFILKHFDYWEDDCGLEFSLPYKNLRNNLKNAMEQFEVEIDL